MPHFIVEYTDNLKEDIKVPQLLEEVHRILISRKNIFPIGGIRSRAIELKDYRVADGTEDDAFLHATLKIATGRSEEIKAEVCEAIFEVIKGHFEVAMNKRYLALSMELVEFSDLGTYKQNNIHSRF
ncbi:5-carboxymethyl-2-hydroxymuconate Delta-isomerase [Psychrobacillus sp. NPDC093200]|uniref:5-carboxymethyl-2-hydroxymuconate Delta-isomerase n=1 Tax=Psychrobacillus sp. NPDC093200 TaxID=3390656 RepID=UPI003D04764B